MQTCTRCGAPVKTWRIYCFSCPSSHQWPCEHRGDLFYLLNQDELSSRGQLPLKCVEMWWKALWEITDHLLLIRLCILVWCVIVEYKKFPVSFPLSANKLQVVILTFVTDSSFSSMNNCISLNLENKARLIPSTSRLAHSLYLLTRHSLHEITMEIFHIVFFPSTHRDIEQQRPQKPRYKRKETDGEWVRNIAVE